MLRIYDMVHTTKPEGIENKKAYIIGGGIAGLATAVFLTTEAQMPGKNITVFEQLKVVGGSMDAAGDSKHGYTSRNGNLKDAWSASGIFAVRFLLFRPLV